jgi:hypothetical protein
MKTLSAFLLVIVGCSSYDSEIEDYIEDDSEETSENYLEYVDFEQEKPVENTNCPVSYQEVLIKGKRIILEIPSICNYFQIDKGRPVDDNQFNAPNQILIDEHSQESYQ